MSAHPHDGVTNGWGQAHDIRNLFVSDGSAFSSPGSANPTLTIVALALRQGDLHQPAAGGSKSLSAVPMHPAVASAIANVSPAKTDVLVI
jgi:choline dehydrogenase-like flavoprotein